MPWWNRTQPGLATATHGTSHPPSHAFSQTEITPHAHPPERPPSAPVGPDTSAPSFQLLPVDVPPSIVPQPAVPAQPQQTGALPRASEAPQGAVGLAAGPSRISTESDKGAKGSGQGQGQGKRGGAGGAGAGGGRRKAASGPVADLPFRVKDPQVSHLPLNLCAQLCTRYQPIVLAPAPSLSVKDPQVRSPSAMYPGSAYCAHKSLWHQSFHSVSKIRR